MKTEADLLIDSQFYKNKLSLKVLLLHSQSGADLLLPLHEVHYPKLSQAEHYSLHLGLQVSNDVAINSIPGDRLQEDTHVP